jgi:hypothetical protein
MSRTSIAQKIKTGTKKWDCIKLKHFCTAKKTITTIKRKLTIRERLCQLLIG